MDVFDERIEELARQVIGAAIEVHTMLGPGHPEAPYCNALAREFDLRGIPYEREYRYAIVFKDAIVGEGRLDFFVGGRLTVEVKAVEDVIERHKARTGNYLTFVKEPLGLLLNFNVMKMKDGIHRVVRSMFRK